MDGVNITAGPPEATAPDFIPDEQFTPDAPAPPVSHAPAADMQTAPQAGPAPSPTPSPASSTENAPDFIPDEQFVSDEEKYGTTGQTAITAAEKFGQGLIGPLAPLAERALGVPPEDIRLRAKTNEGVGALSELVGFGTGLFFGTGEAALLGKIGKGAEAAVGLGKAAGLGSKIAGGAVRGAAEMAALQGGEEATKLITKDPEQTATSALINVGLSTVLGTAFGAGFAAVPALWTATAGPTVEKTLSRIKADWGFGNPLPGDEHIVAPVIKSALSVLGGVSRENIEAYAANREAILNAPEFMEVYSNSLDHILDMQANLETKKATYQQAKSSLNEYLAKQKVHLRQMGYDAGAADKMANDTFKEAQTRIALGLQENALAAAPKAFSAVQKLKTNAIQLSQGAREILNETPGELSLKPILEAVRPMQDELYAKGFPERAEALGKQMEVFTNQYGDKISYPDAKSMIQGLQQRGNWTFGANEVSNGLSSYYNKLSGIMNNALKDAVPAYRRAMEPTASAFELLDKLDKYATPEVANKSVLSLNKKVNYVNDMPMLKALEAQSGINFVNELEHYANPEVIDAMTKAIPEYKATLRTAEAVQSLKDPETRAALENAQGLSKPFQEFGKAQKNLQFMEEQLSKLKGVTPATLESKMKSVMGGKNQFSRSVLENIPGMEGMTIPEILDLIHVRESFEKGAANGSRNVNLWSKIAHTVVSSGIGGITGGLIGGPVAAGIAATMGAGVGAIIDKDGPAIVRDLLDKYLNKYGDLPKAVGATPEATKAALVQFLGKDVPPDAKAFKSTINYLNDAKKGPGILKRSADTIFKSGEVLPQHLYPDPEKTKKLDERTKKLQDNEQGMLDVGGGLGNYMPEHGAALAAATMRATKFINQNRPQPVKGAFFDHDIEPTKAQMSEYHRGLQIAEQPLITLQHLKDGTLVPQDIQILSAIHPQYYENMKTAVMESLTNHTTDGGKVPYGLRQSLSLFVGHELDSSMTQPMIMAAQMVFAKNQQQAPPPATKTNKMGEMAKQYMTANQSSETRQNRAKT